MVILVVFKGFLLVKKLAILIQIVLDSPIYYYYGFICLYSKYVCFYVFIRNIFFIFFRNVLNSTTVKINSIVI